MTVTDSTADTPVVTADDVCSIAQDVWSSFLVLDLEEHPLGKAALPLDGRTMTGCVHVSGEWQGSIFVELTSDHAVQAAEAMFAADPGSLTPGEVGDAIGELTNMVGGNIKSLLPAPSKLSLPSVAEGLSYTVRVPGATLVDEITLVCEAGPLHVSVWKV